VLIADPVKRLTFQQMLDHEWMTMDLTKEPLNIDKSALNEYQKSKKQMSMKNLEASGLSNYQDMAAEK
jgi:hypothetical protein